MEAKDFWQLVIKKGFNFFSGVPCSILKPILANIPEELKYIPATREDSALGVVSGAFLAGKKGGILIQNSGLGNIVNGLTSFNLIYKIPVLIIITWRGEPGKTDAPEHEIMGKITLSLLDRIGIPYKVINETFVEQLAWAEKAMKEKKIPVALILKEEIFK